MPLAIGSQPHSSRTTQNHLFRPIDVRENIGGLDVHVMLKHPFSLMVLARRSSPCLSVGVSALPSPRPAVPGGVYQTELRLPATPRAPVCIGLPSQSHLGLFDLQIWLSNQPCPDLRSPLGFPPHVLLLAVSRSVGRATCCWSAPRCLRPDKSGSDGMRPRGTRHSLQSRKVFAS